MESSQDIIYELLSTGMYDKGVIENISEITTTLRKLHFDLIEWFDKSCYILVNTGNQQELILGYNEEENQEIEDIFYKISHGKYVTGNLLNSLVDNKWLDIIDDKYTFSKRSLVIFYDKILQENGIYKKCRFCNFLVKNVDTHDYCQKIFESESGF